MTERRQNDRRDSPRYPMSFLVRYEGSGETGDDGQWEEREGDLSIGGIHWKGKTAPVGKLVDVRFRLPGVPKELRAQGEIIRLSEENGDVSIHVRFTELDVQSELAIAKYLDELIAAGAPTA